VAVLTSCQRTEPQPAADPTLTEKVDALSRQVEELKGLLAELKRAKPGAEERCRAWLDANLVPGKTTVKDVKTLLGPECTSLDRPERDELVTVQYPVGDPAGRTLVFDFVPDRKPISELPELTPPLPRLGKIEGDGSKYNRYEFGLAICGFCPHILVDDGAWRLEGKMLPGAIGGARERADVLVLPRASVRSGSVRVKLANWAPEVEHLDDVALGVCEAADGDELDFDARQTPYLWRAKRACDVAPSESRQERDHWRFDGATGSVSLLVLEMRNTEKFEKQMRQFHAGQGAEIDACLRGADGKHRIAPVGTKFFRRVVVPIPGDGSAVAFTAPAGLWWIRRAWLADGHVASMKWLQPSRADGSAHALSALQMRDGNRLRLGQHEEATVTFAVPDGEPASRRFALQLSGYYEFARDLLPSER
jgi:hypothetical protein